MVAGFTKFAVYTSPLLNQLRPVRHVRSHIYKVLYWGSGDACYWPFLLPASYYQPFPSHGLFYQPFFCRMSSATGRFLLSAPYYQPFFVAWALLPVISATGLLLSALSASWALLPAISATGLLLSTLSASWALLLAFSATGLFYQPFLPHGRCYRPFLLPASYHQPFLPCELSYRLFLLFGPFLPALSATWALLPAFLLPELCYRPSFPALLPAFRYLGFTIDPFCYMGLATNLFFSLTYKGVVIWERDGSEKRHISTTWSCCRPAALSATWALQLATAISCYLGLATGLFS